MNTLNEFQQRVEAKLQAVEQQKRQKHAEAQQYFMDIRKKAEQFKEVAERVLTMIVQPRLEKLASYFENAGFVAEPGRSLLHPQLEFAYTEQFPATAKVELAVTHDAEFRDLVVSYTLDMNPVIMQYEHYHQLSYPLDAVDEPQLAQWVDDRLCDFVDTYLKLEKAGEYQAEMLATDPVCGMRVVKDFAAGQMEMDGQVYYFCVPECQRQFAEDPRQYLRDPQK